MSRAAGIELAVRDVPELVIDLPPEAAEEMSDDALVAAVRAANGRAFVAFKDRKSARVAATARFEVAEELRADRVFRRGTRAAVSARSIREGFELLEEQGATVLQYYGAIGVAYVSADPTSVVELRASPLVDYVEAEIRGRLHATGTAQPARLSAAMVSSETVPWGIDSIGAPAAWSVSTGENARLLIVDNGRHPHEDLQPIPPGGCNLGMFGGCTSDGYRVHGTFVNGVATARSNGIGVVGVAPGMAGTNVYHWGACNASYCDESDVVLALNWAADSLGALGVINLSLGFDQSRVSLANAVAAAWSAGHVIVAAAGNDWGEKIEYPAAYSNVLGVAGVNEDLSFADQGTTGCFSFSNWGTHVDLVAPFEAYTTSVNDQYNSDCGTSYAAPHVSGVAVLVRAANPGWTNGQVVGQMLVTARDLGVPGPDTKHGRGLVRADLAAGLYAPRITASIVSDNVHLTWPAVPLAQSYRIYRRVTPTQVPQWQYWFSTNTNSYTDQSTQASSLHGYNSQPGGQTAISYYVTAVAANGYESGYYKYATYLPLGSGPQPEFVSPVGQ